MKILKKQFVTLLLFFVLSSGFYSLSAANFIVVTATNLEEVVDYIVTNYNNGQGDEFRAKVYSFLSSQLPDGSFESTSCQEVIPKVIEAQFGVSISFEWQTHPRKIIDYEVNQFNLRTLETKYKHTDETSITFQPLAGDFHLFSFLANCTSVSSSNPVIIIADKDIFFHDPSITPENEEPRRSNKVQGQIAPNPFSDQLAINIQSTTIDPLRVLLYDISGRVVKSINTNTIPGDQSFTISTADLANGWYHLIVQTPHQNWQQKVVKQE